MQLRLSRKAGGIAILKDGGLPSVVNDAMPAGYGADRLHARHHRNLTPLELLELGPPDGVGAIEVCHDIERKLAWRPHPLFASAYTVLGLDAKSLPGDVQRSYLVLADQMRRWITNPEHCRHDLHELWRRMAYNALVGNHAPCTSC